MQPVSNSYTQELEDSKSIESSFDFLVENSKASAKPSYLEKLPLAEGDVGYDALEAVETEYTPLAGYWNTFMARMFSSLVGDERLELPSSLVVVKGIGLKKQHFPTRKYLNFAVCESKDFTDGSTRNVLNTIIWDDVKRSKVKGFTDYRREQTLTSLLENGCQIFYIPGERLPQFVKQAQTGACIEFTDIKPILIQTIKAMCSTLPCKDHARGLISWIEDQIGCISPHKEAVVFAWLKSLNLFETVPLAQKDMLQRLVTFDARKLCSQAASFLKPGEPQSIAQIPGIKIWEKQQLLDFEESITRDGSRKGAVICGASGVGKTMIARILAATSGRNFVKASCASWAKSGSLSDHLNAMQSSFEEAANKAPSILFVDELDSLSSRGGMDVNRSYNTQVINGFLEFSDGLNSRGDVVLLSATNFLDNVDAALLREGRFGKQINISAPDHAGLVEIAKHYIGDNSLVDGLEDIILRMGSANSAQVASMVQTAQEFAREQQKPLSTAMVQKSFEQMLALHLKGKSPLRDSKSTAMATVARALVANMCWQDEVDIEYLSVQPGFSSSGRVVLKHHLGSFPRSNAADILCALHVEIAGACAQKILAEQMMLQGENAWQAFSEDEAKRTPVVRELAGEFLKFTSMVRSNNEIKPSHLREEAEIQKIIQLAKSQISDFLRKNWQSLQRASYLLEAQGSISGDQFKTVLYSPLN